MLTTFQNRPPVDDKPIIPVICENGSINQAALKTYDDFIEEARDRISHLGFKILEYNHAVKPGDYSEFFMYPCDSDENILEPMVLFIYIITCSDESDENDTLEDVDWRYFSKGEKWMKGTPSRCYLDGAVATNQNYDTYGDVLNDIECNLARARRHALEGKYVL